MPNTIEQSDRSQFGLTLTAPGTVTTYTTTFTGIPTEQEVIDGTDGNDTITPGSSTNDVFGFGGDDTLFANSSTGAIVPGVFYGGAGADTFLFDAITNTANGTKISGTIADFSVADGDVIDLTGTAYRFSDLTIAQVSATQYTIKVGSGVNLSIVVEGLSGDLSFSSTNVLTSGGTTTGTSGGDTITVPSGSVGGGGGSSGGGGSGGGSGGGILSGGVANGLGGNDSINGSAGADTLNGGTGNDTISGNAGNDYIQGGTQNDSLNGGAGIDTVFGGDGSDVVDGGADNDTVNGNMGSDIVNGGAGNDRVSGGKGSDASVQGGLGDDLVNGNNENDTVYGGAGNDTVRGGKNDDVIFGNDGNDYLWGDLGNDTMTGGAGDDTFAFIAGHGTDVVSDFVRGEDMLQFSSGLFATPAAAVAAFTNGTISDSGGGSVTLTGIFFINTSDVVIV